MILWAININLQYASIPKRHLEQMVDQLEAIVDCLENRELVATLFFTGVSAERLATDRPGLVQRIRALVRRGRVDIGSHGYAHAVLTVIPPKDQLLQVEWGRRAVADVFGQSSGFFAPEFGYTRTAGAQIAAAGEGYVIARKSRRRLEAFRAPVSGGSLVVLRPAGRASDRIKQALMGIRSPPQLSMRHDYLLVADAEYPYFASVAGRDTTVWSRLLDHYAGHETGRIADWLQQQSLSTREYAPRVRTKHRSWFKGNLDYEIKLQQARGCVDRDPTPERIKALLLAENSDGYEAMTQGYQGNGWDIDLKRSLTHALAGCER